VVGGLNVIIPLLGSALILAGCVTEQEKIAAYRAEIDQAQALCTKFSPPTTEQLRSMPTSQLYGLYKESTRAADQVAFSKSTGAPIEACTVVLASKNYELERELKYR
jgi:PBP1b-binding outer membrane lipoprotein LpoB